MHRRFVIYGLLTLAVLFACSQKTIHEADIFVASKEGRGAMLIDGEAGHSEGIDLGPVFFDYNKATLKTEGKKVLAKHAEWLRKHPKTRLQIEGTCDERGSEEYNMKLGQRRAAAAKAYLTGIGIDESRIAVVSHGRLPGRGEKTWAKNRRGQFIVYYGE